MQDRYKVKECDSIFESQTTKIIIAIRETDKSEVIFKIPVEKFPTSYVFETYEKDFHYTKILHLKYPECFIDMLEILYTDHSVILVQQPEGESLTSFLLAKGTTRRESLQSPGG